MSMPRDSTASTQWFATCPRGTEGLLYEELGHFGAEEIRETVAGVHFSGPLACAYRACLWSRLANRILMPLFNAAVRNPEELYDRLRAWDWGAVMQAQNTLAIDFIGQGSGIRNSQFGAQRCKDAIVDWFREHRGQRPSVDRTQPDIRFNIHLAKNRVVVALDFSGGSLHRRGYRLQGGRAPLKENLAAALLLRAGWAEVSARGGALLDPMCGSGTLLLEGAMIAADIAPGLRRPRFGFECWPGHNEQQWEAIIADARGRALRNPAGLPEIRGYDQDPGAVRNAQENIDRAGLEKVVRVSCKPLARLRRPTHRELVPGLVICNPPYGERLGEKHSLRSLYHELGSVLKREFSGWQAAVFTADENLARAVGLRSHKQYRLPNAGLDSRLLLFSLTEDNRQAPLRDMEQGEENLSEGARMFANRIRKNRRQLRRWLEREAISCYRLYDADMPEYAVAVDVYGDHLQVAEYEAPAEIDAEAAAGRLQDALSALPGATGISPANIVVKQRRRQRGSRQYEKRDSTGAFLEVREGRARFLVNLHDYLDTGLFLDHRPLRRRIAEQARGRDFLNLYCYTGTASVQAALGGARSTTSVDLSRTYLDWYGRNLALNSLPEKGNRAVRADCLPWLQSEDRRYDIVLLDPPSFSNSSSMSGTLDIQRDQGVLIHAVMRLLRPSGVVYFSTNRRGFSLDPALEAAYECRDITPATLDPDFQRSTTIHRCWQLTHRSGEPSR